MLQQNHLAVQLHKLSPQRPRRLNNLRRHAAAVAAAARLRRALCRRRRPLCRGRRCRLFRGRRRLARRLLLRRPRARLGRFALQRLDAVAERLQLDDTLLLPLDKVVIQPRQVL